MPGLLTDLLAAGTIYGLDGDDERFAKMERAAATVAAVLRDKPPMLIRAVLAGLDPDIPPDDPALCQAEEALGAEWKSMASVFADKPVGWLRFILLGACEQVAEGKNVAILWLTAADTLPCMRLGKEEPAVRRALTAFAEEAEKTALEVEKAPATSRPSDVKVSVPDLPSAGSPTEVDRDELLQRIAGAAGQNYRNQQRRLPNANPHWPNNNNNWSWDFADRMRDLLADELDALASDLVTLQSTAAQQLHANQKALAETLQGALTNQRQWVHRALGSAASRQRVEQLRLDALWWSEALYSTALRCSYRELPASLTAAVMAIELLDVVTLPTPASVGYLLAETVHRLAGARHDEQRKLSAVLGDLREQRGRLPAAWHERLTSPPAKGRLSIRDIVVLALGDREWSTSEAMRRAGLVDDIEISLPALALAVFRQEQAVRLAKVGQ